MSDYSLILVDHQTGKDVPVARALADAFNQTVTWGEQVVRNVPITILTGLKADQVRAIKSALTGVEKVGCRFGIKPGVIKRIPKLTWKTEPALFDKTISGYMSQRDRRETQTKTLTFDIPASSVPQRIEIRIIPLTDTADITAKPPRIQTADSIHRTPAGVQRSSPMEMSRDAESVNPDAEQDAGVEPDVAETPSPLTPVPDAVPLPPKEIPAKDIPGAETASGIIDDDDEEDEIELNAVVPHPIQNAGSPASLPESSASGPQPDDAIPDLPIVPGMEEFYDEFSMQKQIQPSTPMRLEDFEAGLRDLADEPPEPDAESDSEIELLSPIGGAVRIEPLNDEFIEEIGGAANDNVSIIEDLEEDDTMVGDEEELEMIGRRHAEDSTRFNVLVSKCHDPRAVKMIAHMLRLSPEAARKRASRPVVTVARNLTEAQANTVADKFEQFGARVNIKRAR